MANLTNSVFVQGTHLRSDLFGLLTFQSVLELGLESKSIENNCFSQFLVNQQHPVASDSFLIIFSDTNVKVFHEH